MSEIKQVTVGRIVHFYPNAGDTVARQNCAEFIPAIVVQVWDGDMANLKIFPFGTFEPGEDLRGSVRHKDSPYHMDGQAYWVYPPIV